MITKTPVRNVSNATFQRTPVQNCMFRTDAREGVDDGLNAVYRHSHVTM